MPVCLWNTSQLALTVNDGKTTFPKLDSRGGGGGGEGGGGLEGEGIERWAMVKEEGSLLK